MKADKRTVGQFLDRPNPDLRFYLFWGPDQGQSRAYATRLVQSFGADRFMIISNSIRSDPASLADEAGAIAMFGGRRVIWIEPATEEIAGGVAALLDAPMVESPVVAICAAATKPRELLRLAEASPLALACAAYPPEGRDSERMVIEVGRQLGLVISSALAARIASASSNDRGIVAQELEKFALYLDATPNAPRELTLETVAELGADLSDGDPFGLADLALSGNVRGLADALTRVSLGASAVPVVRKLFDRLVMLAPIQARIEQGERADAVMASLGKSLFWRDKKLLGAMIGRWSAADIEQLSLRTAALQDQLFFGPAPGDAALGEELLAIARAGNRR